jgi:hypothetical protein
MLIKGKSINTYIYNIYIHDSLKNRNENYVPSTYKTDININELHIV